MAPLQPQLKRHRGCVRVLVLECAYVVAEDSGVPGAANAT